VRAEGIPIRPDTVALRRAELWGGMCGFKDVQAEANMPEG
jgi:hypothetical protein